MIDTVTQATELAAGRVFGGRYNVVRKLGEGGIGAVYEGMQINLQQRVAIKVLKPEVSQDELLVARFYNEARIYARINSPYVVKVHDFGKDEADGTLYLVMEFLPGRDLKSVLEGGPLEAARMAALAIQILEGLNAAHELGIVHRDLKPANIMIRGIETDQPFAQVLDFGISKIDAEPAVAPTEAAGGNLQKGLTQAGMIAGTPMYMSPEQCQGKGLDQRSDVYSIGCVFYEMLSGTPPFDAPTALALLTKHVIEAPAPLSSVTTAAIPERLEQAVMRCLAKKPEDRFGTARELYEELQAIQRHILSPEMVNLLDFDERYEDDDAAIPISRRAYGDAKTTEAEEVELVTRILHTMAKAYKSFAMYPKDNPIFKKSEQELSELLSQFFLSKERLNLGIDRFAVFYLKKRVYEDLDLRLSYPFKLFTDGIRKLFFHEGIRDTEIADYLDCLHKISQGPKLATDLVTLMWEKRFEHITYHLVEDLIEEAIPAPEEVGEILTKGTQYRGKERDEEAGGKRGGGGSDDATPIGQLSGVELQRLQVAAQQEADSDDAAAFARSILSVLHQTADPEEALSLVRVLSAVLEALMNILDLEHALLILQPVRALMRHGVTAEITEALDDLVRVAGKEKYVDAMLVRIRDAETDEERALIGRYITLLEPEVAPPILAQLDSFSPETLPFIQMALLVLCRKQPALLEPGLASDSTETVLATIRIAGEIKEPVCAAALAPQLMNSSPEVRLAVVRALRVVGDPQLGKHVAPLIDDPHAGVRMAVLAALSYAHPTGARNTLLRLLNDPRFLQRPQEEQEVVFRVLGQVRGARVVAAMKELIYAGGSEQWYRTPAARTAGLVVAALLVSAGLSQLIGLFLSVLLLTGATIAAVTQGVEKIIFANKRAAELVEPAAMCLRSIDTRESRNVLRYAVKSGPSKTRRVCERVLKMGKVVES